MKRLFIPLTAIIWGYATITRADVAIFQQTPDSAQHTKKDGTRDKQHKSNKMTAKFTPASTGSTPSSTDVRVKSSGSVSKGNKTTKVKSSKTATSHKADTGEKKHQ